MVAGLRLINSGLLITGGRMKNRKSLGQHWLKDRDILLDISNLAAVDGVNTVVEIGPGLGTLTSALFQNFSKVVAIELDNRLAANLPKSFPGKNLEVHNQDILSLNVEELNLPHKYVVAGNIPYYITSPIIQKFLHIKDGPQKIVLLIQKEVAERLGAQEGDYSVLALSAQIYAKVTLGETTISLIKLGFIAPRKKLISNLAIGLQMSKDDLLQIFQKIGIDKNARPADLPIADWVTLEKNIHKR